MKKEDVIMITAVLIDALKIIQNNLSAEEPEEVEQELRGPGRAMNPCEKCGDEMRDGQYGLYCHACYLDRKDKNSKR